MQQKQESYDTIQQEAECGNPHAMLLLSKLYRLGILYDETGEQDIYWLKQFFANKEVEALVIFLDYEEENKPNEEFLKSKAIVETLGFEEEMILQNDIIEAGVSLGLYLSNSTDIEELKCARQALYDSWVASRYEYIEIPDKESVTDILSILYKVKQRIDQLDNKEELQ